MLEYSTLSGRLYAVNIFFALTLFQVFMLLPIHYVFAHWYRFVVFVIGFTQDMFVVITTVSAPISSISNRVLL